MVELRSRRVYILGCKRFAGVEVGMDGYGKAFWESVVLTIIMMAIVFSN